eukprot:gene5407-7494_t
MTENPPLKLLTIGDTAVGKSWLLLRWVGEDKKLKGPAMPTIGIDFKMKTVEIQGKRVKVQCWDTAGQERFRTITASYYRNSQGILLIYDVTRRDTFNNIRTWAAQIQMHADSNTNKILVGNKCDLIHQRMVSHEEGEALAKELKISFIETSAINNINVDEAFMRLTTEVHTRIEKGGGSVLSPHAPVSSGIKPLSSADKPIQKKPSGGFCLIL